MSIAGTSRALAAFTDTDIMRTLRDSTVYICDASDSEWNAFIGTAEDVVYRLDWVSGKIFVVKLTPVERGCFISEIQQQFDGVHAFLRGHDLAHVEVEGTIREPDASYGPNRRAVVPLGARMPRGAGGWRNFRTLVIEVGFYRKWGHTPCHLD